MVSPQEYNTDEMAIDVWENFKKLDESVPPLPPRPLPTNFQTINPSFIKDAEGITQEVEVLEITQAILYALVMKDALALGILPRMVAEVLESTLKDLKWYSFEAYLDIHKTQLCHFTNPWRWHPWP